jgi:hypothetical protein
MKLDVYEALRSDTEKQKRRAKNRQKKLAVENIKMLIATNKIKESINLAKRHGIDARQYGKIVKEISLAINGDKTEV